MWRQNQHKRSRLQMLKSNICWHIVKQYNKDKTCNNINFVTICIHFVNEWLSARYPKRSLKNSRSLQDSQFFLLLKGSISLKDFLDHCVDENYTLFTICWTTCSVFTLLINTTERKKAFWQTLLLLDQFPISLLQKKPQNVRCLHNVLCQ